MGRLIKFLHVLGAAGTLGALAVWIVLARFDAGSSTSILFSSRLAIAAIAKWLVVPSLALVLVSGIAAMAFRAAYVDAGWAWLKALIGLIMFEGVLGLSSGARHAVEVTGGSPEVEAARILAALPGERRALWLFVTLCIVSTMLAIWRPRILRLEAMSSHGGGD